MAAKVAIKETDSLFDELAQMQTRVMHRAQEIFRADGHAGGRDVEDWLKAEQELVWRPAIELTEKDGEICVEVAAPGVDPKAFVIEVAPQDILIKAEMKHEHTDRKGQVHICEFASGNLFRGIHLPKPIDSAKLRAEFENGMLILKANLASEGS